MNWLDELNPQQREAVTHGAGPVLVVAGAGSGKTKTLAYRVAYLIAQGVHPGRILLLTFTRRASEEMLSRATAIMERSGENVVGRVWGGTFHSVANRLLRIYCKQAGLDENFTVMDEADSADMLNVIRHDLDLHSKEKRFPKKDTCRTIYSRCVNGMDQIDDILPRYFPWCEEWAPDLKKLFQQYVIRKQERNVVDYDDLLLYWAHLVSDAGMAAELSGRFDHVLVDEYQDTNRLQASVLRNMRNGNPNIMAVGDDAQSIYGFRAATVRNMLDFPKEFPGAHVVKLEQNYRSVPTILATTNRIIAQAGERYAKDLWSARTAGQRPVMVTCFDETQQDDFVVREILKHREAGIPLRKQAVLFRASSLSSSLEVELAKRNIPYHKYGGLRFLDAAHVKDMMVFLRLAENSRDEMAWFRAVQLLDGIGPGAAGRIIRHVTQQGGKIASLKTFKAPAAAREQFAGLVNLLEELQVSKAAPVDQVVAVRTYYEPMLKKKYDNAPSRLRDLESLERIASGYTSRTRFLVDLQLDPPNSTSDLAGEAMVDEDWLVLSTIHSAKGCEWDVVYVIHASDGCLPSDMATGRDDEIEEERRLTYVATTRARDFLYVTWPLRYYHRRRWMDDAHSYAQPSRFLTPEVRQTMDEIRLVQDRWDGVDEPRQTMNRKLRSLWE